MDMFDKQSVNWYFRCMCYDIKSQLESQLKYAKRYTPELVPEILEKLAPYLSVLDHTHVSGFEHPKLLIYPSSVKDQPVIAEWGLVPKWIANEEEAKKYGDYTLNARLESLTEKVSFKEAAKNQRCVVVVDGFFEHFHKNGKRFPFYIQAVNDTPLTFAGLWEDHLDSDTGKTKKTFTIVTMKANSLMAEIHNNPKLKEPRMPLILTEETTTTWFDAKATELGDLFTSIEVDLTAHTVKPIRGKKKQTIPEEVIRKHHYIELDPPLTLFDD
jgi:putative SOS response-associated peptidase YedK